MKIIIDIDDELDNNSIKDYIKGLDIDWEFIKSVRFEK